MEFNKIWTIAKSLSKLAESELGVPYTKNKLKDLVVHDHFGQLLMSKAQTTGDRLKVIMSAWFMSNTKLSPDDIFKICNNFYVVQVSIFDETSYIKEECGECYGDGYVECYRCEGDGKIDCRSCDGDGTIECDECSGEGTEECRYCDGKGSETETEEDDEGDEVEVEVECVHCDGSGEERCRDCGGSGNFECPECEGTGTADCDSCDGSGSEYCEYCGGSGEQESDRLHYVVDVYQYLVVGKSLKKYDKPLTKEQFDEIEENDSSFDYYMTLNYSNYDDDEDVDETNSQYGMEDSFVLIDHITKLENAENKLGIHGL